MFERRLAVELMLVARPSANLNLPTDVSERVTDGPELLGEVDESDLTADMVKGMIRSIYLKGQALVNVCTNRIPVLANTSKGRKLQKLTFKAALAHGRNTAKLWFAQAVGPLKDSDGNPIGLNQSGRTRLRADLKRGLISRREATFLGIQSALAVTTKFKILSVAGWDDFRRSLFKDCYECSNISMFGKQWKRFATAVQNSLLANLLMEAPGAQLEQIVEDFPTARRVVGILLEAGIQLSTDSPLENRDRMWLVAHLTQSRFLPGPSRKECLTEVVKLKDRLTGPRPGGAQWATTPDQFNSVELACQTVGKENRESPFARDVENTHLSLSNSACLEYTRKEGGKLAILWDEFREFLDSKISDHFQVKTKPSETALSLETLSEAVRRDVSLHSSQSQGLEESPRELYTRGAFLQLAVIREEMRENPAFWVPPHVTHEELGKINRPDWPTVFTDHPTLFEYLPEGFPRDRVDEAYQIAMLNLSAKQARIRKELTGVFDAIGNEIAPQQHVDRKIYEAAYLTEPLESNFNMPAPLVDADGNKILDLKSGIDSRLGMLLFLWSEVEFRKWVAKGRDPLPVDPVPISEPGVKARIATKSLIWINLYLSPASHFIKDTMLSIPGCRVGLKGSDHAWNFEASFGRHANTWGEIEAISTSDLTAATDWLEHDIAARGMKAFLDGRFGEHPATEYLHQAIDLVCSPRLLVEKPSCFKMKGGTRNKSIYKSYLSGPPLLTVEHGGKTYTGFKTNRAILMGEPLTKMLLSLLSIAAERGARASTTTLNPSITEYRRSRFAKHLYACAGDDHIGIGKILYLKQIPRFLEYWSGEISWDKYCISRYGAHYCQDFILKPQRGEKYTLRKLSKLARDGRLVKGPKYKLDHVWLRLFSDRRKVGSAVFEETNPFPGKAASLTERSAWAGQDLEFNIKLVLLQKLGLGRWFPAAYLNDARSYVPKAFGGRGLWPLPGIELVLPAALKHCIVHSDDVAVRIANGSGDSRKLRGVILDPEDKALNRLQELNVRVYTQAEVEDDASRDEIEQFGQMSRTSLQATISRDFIDHQKFDLTEKKISVITKAFEGPSVLKETQKSYEGRMRSVARAQARIFEHSEKELIPSEVVRTALSQPWAGKERLFVRRIDIEGLLPMGIIPSFTIPMKLLGGSMSLIEAESRVLPQQESRTSVLARIESDAMLERLSLDGTSLPESQ